MYCSKCGKENPSNTVFCVWCGNKIEGEKDYIEPPIMGANEVASQPEKNENESPKWKVISLIAIIITSVCLVGFIVMLVTSRSSGFTDSKKYEGDGYSSSKEAVEAYVDALSKNDYYGMLSTFAIETYVDNFDVVERSVQRAAMMPQTMASELYIGTGDYIRNLNVIKRISNITTSIQYQSLFLSGLPFDGKTITLDADYSIAKNQILEKYTLGFNKVGPIKSTSEFVDFSELCSHVETYDSNIEKWEACYKCDKIEENILIISVGSERYYLFVQSACYDGKWYNILLGSNQSAMVGLDMSQGGLEVCR